MSTIEAAELARAGYDALIALDQAVLDAFPLGVYVCDAEGRIMRFNRMAAELWGQTPKLRDAQQRFCGSFRVFAANGRPIDPAATPMAAVLRSGEAQRDVEAIVERPDGSRITCLVNVEPLRGSRARILGALNCFQDITRRKQAEIRLVEQTRENAHLLEAAQREIAERRHADEALKTERELLQTIIDRIPVMITLYDPKKQLLRFNPAFEHTLGWTAEEANGVSLMEACYPDPQYRAIVAKHMEGGANVWMDIRMRTRAGNDIETTWANLRLSDGMHVGIGVDISLRKLHERKLRESEQRLQLALDAAHMGVWQWDLDSGTVIWSPGIEQMHGLAPGSFGGTFEDFKRDIHPGDLDMVQERIDAALKDRKSYHLAYRIIRADGAVRWLEAFGRILARADGTIGGIAGVCMDVTERKQAEQERDLLVAELSHRVKNTLATVISIARQSFAGHASPEEARTSFEARIRALAQTHGRLAEENWAGVSLQTMLLDEFAPYRREDGANVRLSGPPVRLAPRCALPLGLAIHELATNAAKYGALSAKQGAVEVAWHKARENGTLEIEWTESGGPAVAAPERSGFGRLLLERALAVDLKGNVTMEFAPPGLRCRISMPLDGAAGA